MADFNGSIILPERSTTPDQPATGYGMLYTKTDGNWYVQDDAGTETQLGSVAAFADGVATTWGDSADLSIQHDGVSSIIANITGVLEINGAAGSEVVFNEDSADVDLRAEGANSANLWVLNAGLDKIGIANPTPAALLDIRGRADEVQFRIDANSTQTSYIAEIYDSAANVIWRIDDGGQFIRATAGTGSNVFFATADASLSSTTRVGSDTASVSANYTLGKSRTSTASPSAVQTADWLGAINFQGYDGSSFANGGRILAQAHANWASGTNWGTRFLFQAVPAGSASIVEVFRVTGDGVIVNETGADQDFIVEGDTDTNLVRTNAAADLFGVGAHPTGGKVHITGTADEVQFRIDANSTQTSSVVQIYGAGTNRIFQINNTGTIISPISATSAIYIDASREDTNSVHQTAVYSDTINFSNYILAYRAKNTQASPAVINSGTDILIIRAFGRDDVGFETAAQIEIEAVETWSATAHGAGMYFSVKLATTTTLQEFCRFHGSTGITFNAAHADIDFGVYGDTGTIIQTDAAIDGLGFFGVTPVAQPSTTGTTAGFSAGTGTGVNDDSTFTGGTGASAYTIGDIVLAMKQIGALAA